MHRNMEQLGALLALSPEPMFVLDQTGMIVEANEAAAELLGYKIIELVGRSIEALVPGHLHRAQIRGREHFLAKPARQPMATSQRVCALHQSGREIPVEVTIGPLGTGDDLKIVCSLHDMSRRVAVEDHLRRNIDDLDRRVRTSDTDARRTHEHFKLFLKHAPAAIALLDRQMRYLIVSDRWMIDYNLGSRDIHGLCHYDVFMEMPERWKEDHRRCLAGETIRCPEDSYQRQDGTTEWLRWELQPWRTSDGKIGGILIFSEMITARKRAEMALLQSYQQLEERVAERTAALEQMKNDADRANAQKSWFVAAASHDLRQPLQASLAYLSVLSRKTNKPELEELCDKARQPLKAMSDILDVLLDISDLESGQVLPRREDFGVSDLISRVVANAQHQALEKGLRLSYLPDDFAVHSDPKLLERIITNFVTNAIRYTAKGLIGIYSEKLGDKICISVTDTGIGIPPDAIGTIFEDHVQLNNPARDRRKGLGLGLSIAKRIADSLGHRISVQSELGSGSSFSIELPMAQVTAAVPVLGSPASEATPFNQGENPVVLLIDDDQDVADAMQMLLQSYEFETYMAHGRDAAIAMLESGLIPGLVLCDYRLPGTNGLDVIRQIRRHLNNDIAAVLMTGDTGLQAMPEDMGNCALLHKPVDVDAFFAALNTLKSPVAFAAAS